MPRPEHNDYSRISNLPIDETRFDPRVFHPRFRDRNFAIRVIERERGRRLTTEEVMELFGCNENIARQSRSQRWEEAMEAEGW